MAVRSSADGLGIMGTLRLIDPLDMHGKSELIVKQHTGAHPLHLPGIPPLGGGFGASGTGTTG